MHGERYWFETALARISRYCRLSARARNRLRAPPKCPARSHGMQVERSVTARSIHISVAVVNLAELRGLLVALLTHCADIRSERCPMPAAAERRQPPAARGAVIPDRREAQGFSQQSPRFASRVLPAVQPQVVVRQKEPGQEAANTISAALVVFSRIDFRLAIDFFSNMQCEEREIDCSRDEGFYSCYPEIGWQAKAPAPQGGREPVYSRSP
jgi:hypothetical protein